MDDHQMDYAALNDCLRKLQHLVVDISRLRVETSYEEKRGGFGDVQVSTLDADTPTPKLVVAKTIRLRARTQQPQRVAFRLARELKVWARLQHPHILPLLGFYLGEGFETAVLISDYMPYGDLKDFIEQHAPPWRLRLELVRDLTDGLTYLHGQNPPIRHGDLKTGNVVINAEKRAMLADFGLSELVLEKETGESLPSDIWAWACLVLEVLADTMAYAERSSEFSVIIALMNKELPSEVETLPIPVPVVKQLLAACWHPQPEQRPSAEYCLHIITGVLFDLHSTDNLDSVIPSGSNFQPVSRPNVAPEGAEGETSTAKAVDVQDNEGNGLYSVQSMLKRLVTPLLSPMFDLNDVDPLDHNTTCNACNNNIFGIRYQCANCPSFPSAYNLCAECELRSFDVHPRRHVFLKINRRVDHPVQSRHPLLPNIYKAPTSRVGSMNLTSGHLRFSGPPSVYCDLCMAAIEGEWFRCAHCSIDLCEFHERTHYANHVFLVIKEEVDWDVLRALWDFEDPSKNPPLLEPVFRQ